jgi:general secretion pathway protein E
MASTLHLDAAPAGPAPRLSPVEALARRLGLSWMAGDDFPAVPALQDRVTPAFLKRMRVVPLHASEDKVWVAMVDPTDQFARKALAMATGREVVPVVAALEDVEAALTRYFDQGRGALDRIARDIQAGPDSGGEDIEHLKDLAQEAPVIRFVNHLLVDAVRMEASDIHIEPSREHLRVRFRVHGRLREIGAPPARLGAAVVSRIKILARLDIAERRLPQDGRAMVTVLDQRLDLRVATVPTIHGESLVIRLLRPDKEGQDFGDLGLKSELEARLKRQLEAPHGMLLVTGPTGSGKTTTLYAALRHLNRGTDKIVSIEDPVEYQIEGVTQIQVKPEIDLSFARILRSVVRHDPDIVMVGETRDPETAEIAVHAALTGHLLLTTLHTNSAAGAIGRLLDMGVEPYLLASVLRAVLAQRLVGVLCPTCKTPREATPLERGPFEMAGLVAPDQRLELFHAPGCELCGQQGFVGRVGIFELLEVDERIRILIRDRAPAQTIVAAAQEAGMEPMFQDGLRKVLAGITTLDEVRAVTEDG